MNVNISAVALFKELQNASILNAGNKDTKNFQNLPHMNIFNKNYSNVILSVKLFRAICNKLFKNQKPYG